MGHVGLLPQYSKSFKLKGKSMNQKKKIFEDAIALSESGVFAIVIECVVEDLAKKITNNVKVPTIGIGSSKYCDGQVLVINDILNIDADEKNPRFVKKYINLKKIISAAIDSYTKDVKSKKFPSKKHTYL